MGSRVQQTAGGAGHERTASASENEVGEVHCRSCCADSDVTAEVPAVGTGSICVFLSARVIAPTSPRVSPLALDASRVSNGLPVFGAFAVQDTIGPESERMALCSGDCTLRDGLSCAKGRQVRRARARASARGLTFDSGHLESAQKT